MLTVIDVKRKEISERYGFKESTLDQDYTDCLILNSWELLKKLV